MKKVVVSLISALAVLLFVSCGSKPAAEDDGSIEAPVIEQEETTEEETSDEETPVEDEDLTDEESLLALIDNSRKLAIDAGAEDNAADLLKQLDDAYAAVKGDKDSLKKNAADLAKGYTLLADYLKAKSAKQEIDDNGFASLAQSTYDQGVRELTAVEEAYAGGAENLDEVVLSNATSAYVNFNTVLLVGYKKAAKDERAAAYEAKKSADSVKAGVSQKERYKAATDLFKSGDSSYAMQNAKKAFESYKTAKEEYLAMYNEIAEKRAAAQKAIEEAKARVAASAEFAEQADKEAPITEKVEGIEDEDAVLLEEDTFENPEDAEIDVSEDLTIEAQVNIVVDEVSDMLNAVKGDN